MLKIISALRMGQIYRKFLTQYLFLFLEQKKMHLCSVDIIQIRLKYNHWDLKCHLAAAIKNLMETSVLRYNSFNPFSAGTDIKRQNLTSKGIYLYKKNLRCHLMYQVSKCVADGWLELSCVTSRCFQWSRASRLETNRTLNATPKWDSDEKIKNLRQTKVN